MLREQAPCFAACGRNVLVEDSGQRSDGVRCRRAALTHPARPCLRCASEPVIQLHVWKDRPPSVSAPGRTRGMRVGRRISISFFAVNLPGQSCLPGQSLEQRFPLCSLASLVVEKAITTKDTKVHEGKTEAGSRLYIFITAR